MLTIPDTWKISFQTCVHMSITNDLNIMDNFSYIWNKLSQSTKLSISKHPIRFQAKITQYGKYRDIECLLAFRTLDDMIDFVRRLTYRYKQLELNHDLDYRVHVQSALILANRKKQAANDTEQGRPPCYDNDCNSITRNELCDGAEDMLTNDVIPLDEGVCLGQVCVSKDSIKNLRRTDGTMENPYNRKIITKDSVDAVLNT